MLKVVITAEQQSELADLLPKLKSSRDLLPFDQTIEFSFYQKVLDASGDLRKAETKLREQFPGLNWSFR